ncbi:hypothetical protein B484DRAFT_425413, partial [Ochromonadaceae sp. CCMP2298]
MRQLSQAAVAGEVGAEQQLSGERWNDAMKAAAGERTILIGASSIEGTEGRLKKALKKREKKKERSASKWADRLSTISDAEAAKCSKREANLQGRILSNKGIAPPPVEKGSSAGGGDSKGDKEGAGSGRKRLWS